MRGFRFCVMKEKWYGINKIFRNVCGYNIFGLLLFIFIYISVIKFN